MIKPSSRFSSSVPEGASPQNSAYTKEVSEGMNAVIKGTLSNTLIVGESISEAVVMSRMSPSVDDSKVGMVKKLRNLSVCFPMRNFASYSSVI
jgi:hypothetical protein